MLPLFDTLRARAANRRLALALGVSVAVHLVGAGAWHLVGRPNVRPLAEIETYPEMLDVVEIAAVPDPPGGSGGGGPAGTDDALTPAVAPPSSPDAPAPPPPSSEPLTTAPDATQLTQAPTPRASAPERTTLRPSAGVPAGPGAPSSAPPGASGRGSGSGSGDGPGSGRGAGGAGSGGNGTGLGDGSGPGSERIVERPERSPSVSQMSLPEYPSEARAAGVGARVRVRALIGSRGEVIRAEIIERTLVERRRERTVDSLPYGMEASLIEAARRYEFRPARDGGEPVRAFAVFSLSINVH